MPTTYYWFMAIEPNSGKVIVRTMSDIEWLFDWIWIFRRAGWEVRTTSDRIIDTRTHEVKHG